MQPVEHWAMADDEKDDRPLRRAGTDETIDESRKRKRLEDCTLPEGFTLVTPRPRQMVMEGLLIWSFILKFEPWSGDRRTLYHVARYELRIPDDMQMSWALSDFTRDLVEDGVDVGEAAAFVSGATSARGPRRLNELLLKTESKLAGKIRGGGAYFAREVLRRPARVHGSVAA